MEKKYGRDVVDDLETRAGPYKWTREELNDLRVYYKGKIADLHNGIAPERIDQPLSMSSMFADLPRPDSLS